MSFSREEFEKKLRENKITDKDIDQLVKDNQDAEKYRQLKEKIIQIDDDSYLFDRLEACDTSGVTEILRSYLTSKGQ